MTGVPCYLLDTNIILRFLRGDHATHSPRSKALFDKARNGNVILEIPFIAIIETLHTLLKFYKVEKQLACQEILKILNSRGIRFTGPHWIFEAFNEFLTRKISFGDVCIACEARSSGRVIASFDGDFDLLADVKRFEPK